ncbi:thiamine pyrophosphate-binding protein [Noviherbaspirillum malthae]|uniref:thiamine pyrophosphate-binding protein n=1 Tax=Noviherbaspirillum malthae TaxID=1260987 RepID=UPI001E388DDA|nr:thiamine pyrophosphate-binding protein [Noviherbaspirillum malthae]
MSTTWSQTSTRRWTRHDGTTFEHGLRNMTQQHTLRGADVVARTLERLGVDRIFSLSGNHIMSLFDALLETGIEIIHVRHEAACVHMADAYARLTGKPGIALVTGGQAHVNACAALVTASASAAPVVLLSGHAALSESGRGAFQELAQARIAEPLTKLSWTAESAARLGHDLARALRVAREGRPGPVHLSLPVDLLEQRLAADDIENHLPAQDGALPEASVLSPAACANILEQLNSARKPLILHGPQLCGHRFRDRLRQLEARLRVAVIGMESPRGIRDPSLGAFAEILGEADFLLLLDKDLDFTLGFGAAPALRADCRLVAISPEGSGERGMNSTRIATHHAADAVGALESLETAARQALPSRPEAEEWLARARAALQHRPPEWSAGAERHRALNAENVYPVDLCDAAARAFAQHPSATLVSDGGEFGQWAQAIIKPQRRLINGPSGTIGAAVPYAVAAKLADHDAPVFVLTGDGSFGFHLAEIDTALRHHLPIVIIIGNDARWNAEHQIQLRSYGPSRTHACALLPSRYDLVVEALGGHGELVTRADQLDAAIARAVASGKPACVNVFIESVPAPVIRLSE